MTDRQHEHERDLAAAGALGPLSGEEAALLEEEAARSSAFAAQLDEYRDTVAMLELAIAREQPPPDLFEQVLTRIETDDAPARTPEPVAQSRVARHRVRRLWPRVAVGAAAAAAVVALAFALSADEGPEQAQARAAVQGTDEFAAVHGEARLYDPAREDGTLVLSLSDVPPPAAGEHYEVWVLRQAGEGEMEAVGVFSPEDSAVDLEFRLPGAGEYEAVDVSVEADGGAPAHSGRSLAGGSFEQTAS